MAVLTRQQIEHIFHAHGLGEVQTVTRPARGSVNGVFLINGAYVLRVQPRRHMRFYAEQQAYELLRQSSVPVPQVVALDTSGLRAPYSYLILTYLPGQPLIDLWPTLSPEAREKVAFEAGAHLARIHNVSLDFYGNLGLNQQRFNNFYEYAIDFCARFVLPASQTLLYTPKMHEQLSTLLHVCRPYIQHVSPHLVHSDYHFENILVENDTVTGIIDIEWALSGDPTWDFLAEDKWEEQCAGSRLAVYAGYRSVRRLDTQHRLKTRLYKAIHALETIAEWPEHRAWAVERFHRLFGDSDTSGDVPPH
jgi:aminoglycoside phosphotransferase (APT) family kinase protein